MHLLESYRAFSYGPWKVGIVYNSEAIFFSLHLQRISSNRLKNWEVRFLLFSVSVAKWGPGVRITSTSCMRPGRIGVNPTSIVSGPLSHSDENFAQLSRGSKSLNPE